MDHPTKAVFILGRQPAIGRAELESLFGAAGLQPLGEHAVQASVNPKDVNFERLGSSTRLAKLIAPLNTNQWPGIARHLEKKLPELIDYLPQEGKIKLGISCFGLPVTAQQLFKSGLALKKVCKATGRSVRLVPNTEPALSSAQVLHNQLTGDLGIELLVISDGRRAWLAQTLQVQDINAYAHRDQGRPKRDARVGMLPPKLAQTIVNLGTGPVKPEPSSTVLDPFCGTGVILQEAALMGYSVYGTDLEPRMVDYSAKNLAWLEEYTTIHSPLLEQGDATNYKWQPSFTTVASETYLGRPLSSWPQQPALQDIISTCNTIIEKFLLNMAEQAKPGLRLCLAVPAWKAPGGKIYHLPLLDRLSDLGYNRVRFEHARDDDLVYSRPEQLVARELLVITRK